MEGGYFEETLMSPIIISLLNLIGLIRIPLKDKVLFIIGKYLYREQLIDYL